MALTGSCGPWEFQPLGVVDPGGCGPFEWRPVTASSGKEIVFVRNR